MLLRSSTELDELGARTFHVACGVEDVGNGLFELLQPQVLDQRRRPVARQMRTPAPENGQRWIEQHRRPEQRLARRAFALFATLCAKLDADVEPHHVGLAARLERLFRTGREVGTRHDAGSQPKQRRFARADQVDVPWHPGAIVRLYEQALGLGRSKVHAHDCLRHERGGELAGGRVARDHPGQLHVRRFVAPGVVLRPKHGKTMLEGRIAAFEGDSV